MNKNPQKNCLIVTTVVCTRGLYDIQGHKNITWIAVFADAWLSGWLAEISADLREVVAH